MIGCDFASGCCSPATERSSLHRAVLGCHTRWQPPELCIADTFVTGHAEAAFLLLRKEDAAHGFAVQSHLWMALPFTFQFQQCC